MDNEFEQAFMRGMRKCALEKEAFIPQLTQMVAPMVASSLVSSRLLPRLMKNKGLLGNVATKANNVLAAPGVKGNIAQTGLHMAMMPVTDAVTSRLLPSTQQ